MDHLLPKLASEELPALLPSAWALQPIQSPCASQRLADHESTSNRPHEGRN